MWSKQKLAKALKVNVAQNFTAAKIVIDSRVIKKGDIFLCLKGDNFDGHDFKAEAINKGACLIIAEKSHEQFSAYELIIDDSYQALIKLAQFKRANNMAKFIAITGSVGKTTFKEALKNVLSAYDVTFASLGNFNNHIGMPLCLANLADNTKYAIFELGMNHAGEIEYLSKILQPDIALITKITEAHIGNFASIEGIIEAKAEICAGFNNKSIIILNNHDINYDKLRNNVCNKYNIPKNNIYSFGYKGLNLVINKVMYGNKGINIAFRDNMLFTQKFSFFNQAIAELLIGIFAILKILKLDFALAIQQLEKFSLVRGRGNIEKYSLAGRNITFINDSYNANFSSMSESIKTLAKINDHIYERKILLIGDMLELGAEAKYYHQKLYEFIKDTNISAVIAIGELMKNLYDILPATMKLNYFAQLPNNLDLILNDLEHNDLVLVKSSKTTNTFKIIDYIKEQGNVI